MADSSNSGVTTGPRVSTDQGSTWISVAAEQRQQGGDGGGGGGGGTAGWQTQRKPIPPILDGDGRIFIAIPSYRDGERCGDTLKSIFEQAENPDKIVVGLVEQNQADDVFCMERYCQYYDSKVFRRKNVRQDVTKLFTLQDEEQYERCPHIHQIRHIAFHSLSAKGPMLARSMARKALGNEEFCLTIDAHSVFVQHWDTVMKHDWLLTENEFAVISTVPADVNEQDSPEIPRQCAIQFRENGFPDYKSPADGVALGLTRPLLGHGWSGAFSFSKCHFEESVPTDPFSYWALPVEQFARYARAWTRGYDTYTPTRHALFHNHTDQDNGHGKLEWFNRRRDQQRKAAIRRAKTILQLKGGDLTAEAQANLGIYGLGKRRTREQLATFTNTDFTANRGNVNQRLQCTGQTWVPYADTDNSISPVDNLFDVQKATNLDPQPEYPLRTQLIYYEQANMAAETNLLLDGGDETIDQQQQQDSNRNRFDHMTEHSSELPSSASLFVLWIFGLIVWYVVFVGGYEEIGIRGGGGGSSQKLRKRKKKGPKDI